MSSVARVTGALITAALVTAVLLAFEANPKQHVCVGLQSFHAKDPESRVSVRVRVNARVWRRVGARRHATTSTES